LYHFWTGYMHFWHFCSVAIMVVFVKFMSVFQKSKFRFQQTESTTALCICVKPPVCRVEYLAFIYFSLMLKLLISHRVEEFKNTLTIYRHRRAQEVTELADPEYSNRYRWCYPCIFSLNCNTSLLLLLQLNTAMIKAQQLTQMES